MTDPRDTLRFPEHPDIDEEKIATLVDAFYAKVRADDRLGPIFDQNISAPWPEHLARMRAFWSGVMLKTGAYNGRPMPAHMKLREMIRPADFSHWLGLFRETARENFAPEIAICFISRAEAIAENLQRGVFFGFGIMPPGSFRDGEFQGEYRDKAAKDPPAGG